MNLLEEYVICSPFQYYLITSSPPPFGENLVYRIKQSVNHFLFFFFPPTKICVRTRRRWFYKGGLKVYFFSEPHDRDESVHHFRVRDSFLKYNCYHFISMLRISFTPFHCLPEEATCPPLSVHYTSVPSCLFNFVSHYSSSQSPWHQPVVSPSHDYS